MTIKLYDGFPYESEFDAKVIEIGNDKNGSYIVLDRTLFFPEEGGQSCDKGTINNVNVLCVKICGDAIFHYVEKPFSIGENVHGKIDFTHRFHNMQMHSAEHILSGLIFERYHFNNVGFHLSDNSATMDYDGVLANDEICALEREVNELIYKGRKIVAGYPSKDELATLNYRSKKELSGPIRIVTIEGIDVCACCAPHVEDIREIGIFKIISCENYKGGVRLNYLAGYRAYEYLSKTLNDSLSVSRLMSVKQGEEVPAVEKALDELSSLRFEVVKLRETVLEKEIEASFDNSETGVFVAEADCIKLKSFAMLKLHKLYPGVCAFFCGNDSEGYKYIVESGNNGSDAETYVKALAEKFNAKGGGRNGSFQGSVSLTKADVCAMFEKQFELC